MARVHPSLARVPKPGPGELLTEDERDHRVRLKLQQLAEKREALRRGLKEDGRRVRLQSGGARSHYETVCYKKRAGVLSVVTGVKEPEEERAAGTYFRGRK